MELVSVYLYNRIPVETSNISNKTFHTLKKNGWYNDERTNNKFTMLNKRIEIGGKWHRTMIRFESDKKNKNGEEVFNLSLPSPFLITECEQTDTGITSWKDTAVFHGPKLGSVSAFIEAGISSQLIDEVYKDLETHLVYN